MCPRSHRCTCIGPKARRFFRSVSHVSARSATLESASLITAGCAMILTRVPFERYIRNFAWFFENAKSMLFVFELLRPSSYCSRTVLKNICTRGAHTSVVHIYIHLRKISILSFVSHITDTNTNILILAARSNMNMSEILDKNRRHLCHHLCHYLSSAIAVARTRRPQR